MDRIFAKGYASLIILCECIIVYYLFHLKQTDCKCSLNYKRNYILCFNIFLVCYSLLILLTNNNLSVTYPILGLLLSVASIVNVVFTIQYVNDLKKQKCNCSESVMRTLMFVLAIIQVCTWAILVLTLIFVAFFFTKTNNKMAIKEMKKLLKDIKKEQKSN
jgi:hypothetical protein